MNSESKPVVKKNFTTQSGPEVGLSAVDDVVSGQWLGIETAPKNSDEILLFAMGDIGVCYWREDNVMSGWTWGLEKRFLNPTHWMPLPSPPSH